jgi:hypothetical protein
MIELQPEAGEAMADDEEYPVMTQFRGTLDYRKIAHIRDDKYGRSATLEEPFGSRMGWFSYTDLFKHGKAESQGYTVYPHIVEMKVAGVSNPVKVTLDEHDLSTIVRLARSSKVREIQNAIR